MKKIFFISTLIMALLVVSCSDDDDNSTTFTLNQTEIDDLKILREEEKLARDVYLFSYDKYGVTIFNSIATSEQKHMDKLLVLLNKYNIEDPVLPNRGEFTNQTLQNLYDSLTAQSDISLVNAYIVGATIEDLDINDIDDFASRTDKADILSTYDKLNCGSRNHMRSYYGKLLENGTTYAAQFISTSKLSNIITGSHEQCGN